ncbi:putative lipoprotein [Tannerella forsythia KS16]|uniref:Putative lipoprotein n=1 Tax=Tannerella forsythia (strain ATCC 43037 / JCM 10827 / CCUG 21028 A / KCTC 5666 / FDC 338) TaxID=203275 RepID=G8UR07_TANFA|nr:putative lipoprotein [Tannerella forsythia 92A2]BAR50167.1 putative lipoprotein [Tannerella forsythia 3313]BAR53008.1 putative lipoprotein [Tannerella forsythia KS16]
MIRAKVVFFSEKQKSISPIFCSFYLFVSQTALSCDNCFIFAPHFNR